MADLKAILNYYIRRNRRLKDQGRDAFSIRDSIFAISTVRNDSKRQRDKRLKELVDAGKAHWVTVKGTAICIGNYSGKIVGGPKKFVGKTPDEAFTSDEVREIREQEESAAKKAEEERKAKEEQERKAKEEQERKEKLHKDRVQRGQLTGEKIREIQKNIKISAKGKNKSIGGYRVTDDVDFLDRHKKKHGGEPPFVGMTNDEFEAAGVALISSPCGNGIMGGIVPERVGGVIVDALIRYNRKTGEMVKGIPGAYILTHSVLKYWEDTDVADDEKIINKNWKRDGYDYFLRQMGLTRGHEN